MNILGKKLNRADIVKVLIVMLLSGVLTGLTACNNIQNWQKQTTIDHLKKIETTTITYTNDTSYTLGTKGLGHYEFVPINVSGIGN